MKKTNKRLLTVLAVVVLVIAAAVIGYFVLFHDADVIREEDGKLLDTKPTWLIGHFAGEDGEARYYKLADVNAPKGYQTAKGAEDLDGDPLTTQFVYAGKKPENDPAQYSVWAVPGKASDALALFEGETGALADGTPYVLSRTETAAELTLALSSPYEGAVIAVKTAAPAETEDEALFALAAAMTDKVANGKKMAPIVNDFKLNFLDDDRWMYLWNGLGATLEITFFAVIIGILLGALVATIRSTWDMTRETMRPGLGRFFLWLLNKLCNIYLTVIRGTPAVIQLMIDYYVIFTSSRNGVLIAIIAFGINSGAYVAEIIRGGIMSIDNGQFEAGRSLGFNYVWTMLYIIIPQALKNVLPALANEFIVLLKETSVAGYVAVKDLTKGGDIIRGVTYSAFMPLIAVALIYLILVMFFTWLVGKLERRLRNSDH